MKRTILLLLLLTSCSIDQSILSETTATGFVENTLRSKTTNISGKSVPNYPVEFPSEYQHYFSNGLTFIRQGLGKFEHKIDPTGLEIRVSNAETTPEYSDILILEGTGNWKDGNPIIELVTRQVRSIYIKANMKGVPTVNDTKAFDMGDYYLLYHIPSPDGDIVEVNDTQILYGFGEPGTQTTFYVEASAEGSVAIKEGLFLSVTEVKVQ